MLDKSSHFSPVDAPSLVFWPPVGTCSLNRIIRYAFGRRHPLTAKILNDHRINR